MIVSARDIVLRMEAPSEHDIRVAMSGNLCRCTGYVGIVRAVQSVISDRRARGVAAIPGGGRDRLGPAGSGRAGETRMSSRPDAGSDRRSRRAATLLRRARPPTSIPIGSRRLNSGKASSSPTQSKRYGPSSVASKTSRHACPAPRLMAARKMASVKGKIRVKVGPISAEFGGVAQITRDEAAHRGTIVGSGRDTRSNSATRGMVAYSVKPDERGAGSRVDVDVGYTLTGMLAQFSRSSLVQDMASRLTAAFAQNLEARLSAGNGAAAAPPVVRELNAGSLITTVVLWQVRRFFGRFFGRS